jgi:hypothetical protein
VAAAGLVHEIQQPELRSAMVGRVFDLDVRATLAGGEDAATIRACLPAFGFRL